MANARRAGESARAKNQTVQEFIAGLRQLEATGDGAELLRVFSKTCTISNGQMDKELEGRDGAARFWKDYRDTFRDIKSQFTRITEMPGVAVLEWTSSGTLKTGGPIYYRGVSIITLDGDEIVDFMAYFDSRHFTAHTHISM
ncbi:MAG: nuclear transport factor 2 family protein [Chloroflexota bacterium]|nr:nuclear transport factor 2 family protein [Chloroflexota bacterium]